MAQPDTAIARHDLSYSYGEFNEEANRLGFIGPKVFPPLAVAKQASSFSRVDIESLLTFIEDTARAADGTYSRGTYEFTPDSYSTDEHGVEEIVDDRRVKMYGDIIPAEQISKRRAINRVLMAYERTVATTVFNASTWSAATTAVSNPWSTKADGTPIADIDAGRESVLSQCGTRPNSLVLSDFALLKLVRTDEVEELLKYSGRDDPKNLGMIDGLSQLLQIPNIIVAGGVYNTAIEGQTASVARVWDATMAMVCCINTDNDLESPSPTIGRTIMWTEDNAGIVGPDAEEPLLIMEEYREENRRGGTIRARFDRDIKTLHVEAGHLLTAVTA